MAFVTVPGSHFGSIDYGSVTTSYNLDDIFTTAAALHMQTTSLSQMAFIGGTGDAGRVLPSGDTIFGGTPISDYAVTSEHSVVKFMPCASKVMLDTDTISGVHNTSSVTGALSDIHTTTGVPFPINTLDQRTHQCNIQFIENGHIDHKAVPFPTDVGTAHMTDHLEGDHVINFVNLDNHHVTSL